MLAFCDYFTPGSSGGAERASFEIYRRLISSGASISVVTVSPVAGEVGRELVDGIEVLQIPATDLSRFFRAQVSLAPRFVWSPRKYVDTQAVNVLHANSVHFQTSIAAARLRSKGDAPLVTTAHLGSPSHLGALLRFATSSYEASVGRLILRRSDGVIAVGHSVSRHLRHLGVSEEKITVVPNGVDHDRFFASTANDRQPDGAPHILFVGRLIPNKGPHLLLEALGALRSRQINFSATFVGDGPMRQELVRRAYEMGLGSHVSFAGHVNDVPRRLRETELLIRPSFTEGLPLAVLEGMASRVCIVAAELPGNSELIRHGENGLLFRTGDVSSLEEQLQLAILDAPLRDSLASQATKDAARYSWDACASATGSVLLEAAETFSSR